MADLRLPSLKEVREALEEWRPLESCRPGYEVSNRGRIRHGTRILKLGVDRYGYLRWSCRRKDGTQTLPTVHSLVAAAFIGPRPDGYQIGHLDGNKANNTVQNLSYITTRENYWQNEAQGTRPKGQQHGGAKFTDQQVLEIRRIYRPFDPVYGRKALAQKYGVDPSTIRRMVHGNLWSHLSGAADD